jgi:hypothetical protein
MVRGIAHRLRSARVADYGADRRAIGTWIGGRFRDGSGPYLAAKEATKRRTARALFVVVFGLGFESGEQSFGVWIAGIQD